MDNEGVFFILSKAENPARIDYHRDSFTMINIKVENLEKAISELRNKGVEFIHSSPQQCPVGVFAAIKDPFGNVMELLEFQFSK